MKVKHYQLKMTLYDFFSHPLTLSKVYKPTSALYPAVLFIIFDSEELNGFIFSLLTL